MSHIDPLDIGPHLAIGSERLSGNTPKQADMTMKAISALWIKMTDIYGRTWTTSYGHDPFGSAGLAWSRALAGLKPVELRRGILACENGETESDWPPSLVAFKSFCLGIPSISKVRKEISIDPALRSRFVVAVHSEIDWHRYKTGDGRLQETLLRDAYLTVRSLAMAGSPLPKPRSIAPDFEENRRIDARHMERLKAACMEIDARSAGLETL